MAAFAHRVRERRGFLALATIASTLLVPLAFRPSAAGLTRLDVVRIRELAHLRRTVGDRVWPGWGSARIPVLLVKGGRAYLFDHRRPPEGFVPLAGTPGVTHGPAGGRLPTGFGAARLWGVPTAIVAGKDVFDGFHSLNGLGRGSALDALMEVGAADSPNTATYVIVMAHESFHAFAEERGQRRLEARLGGDGGALENDEARSRLADAEARDAVQALLRREAQHLQDAIGAEEHAPRRAAARAFLAARDERRKACAAADTRLSALAAYEQRLEWTEGMARYTEHALARELRKGDYAPAAELEEDPDFEGYAKLGGKVEGRIGRAWSRPSRSRSYVVGAALCTLLDRLGVPWKAAALDEGVPLEQLVSAAVGG